MTVTPTDISNTKHCRNLGVRMNAIIRTHRRPDTTLDHMSLVAAAVQVRKNVQALEDTVNKGCVSTVLRERLTCLQQADMDHRAVLAQEIPGWADAVDQARKDYPRCQRAKVMIRAARSLGLWAPMVKGPR